MQRVRIGLTGLAAVFVVVLLAAVFASPSDETPITANMIEQSLANGQAAIVPPGTAQPQEPQAELGVAPGAGAETESKPAAASGAPAR